MRDAEDGKLLIQCAVISVALLHLLLPLLVKIDFHTFLLGSVIHTLYFLLLEDFPVLELGWSTVVSLFGNHTHSAHFCNVISIHLLPRDVTGVLFINMRQWIAVIEQKVFSSVFATTLSFFLCVWFIPILLSLTLDISWKSVNGLQPNPSLAETENSNFKYYGVLSTQRDELEQDHSEHHSFVRKKSLSDLMHRW